jgi:PAS domain S-box-containing protein
MDSKKPYSKPRVFEYPPDQVPETVQQLFANRIVTPGSSRGDHVEPIYTTVINGDRKYVEVSENFCELLGYTSEELIGRRFDEITAPRTTDSMTIFNLFKRLGYMQGLWMFVHRSGYRILIRYESWLRPDTNIHSNIEVVQTFV